MPIAFGETKSDSITAYAQVNDYTFTATAGDTIITRMHSRLGPRSTNNLYAPNGAPIASSANSLTGYATNITKILTFNRDIHDSGG